MLNLSALRNAIAERLWPPPALELPGGNGSPIGTEVATTTAPAEISWRRVAKQATAMWLATRVAYALFTYFVVMFQHAGPAAEFVPFGPRALLASWNRWDGLWYIHIAQAGYWNEQPTAFFPLYPILIKVTTLIFGQHWLFAAMLVSNLGSLLAFIGVGLLAAHEDHSEAAAVRAIRVTIAYPLAFFLVAPYTEGLFLGLAALSLYTARRGLWRWAALWTFLAGLTRPTGIVLLPALGWELGRQRGWWVAIGGWLRELWHPTTRAAVLRTAIRLRAAAPRTAVRPARWRATLATAIRAVRAPLSAPTLPGRPGWSPLAVWRRDARLRELTMGLVAVLAVPCAILLYMAFLQVRFGHPLLWLHVQNIFWRRDSMPIVASVGDAVRQFFDMRPWTYWQARQLVDLGPVLVFGLLTLLNIRRMPFAFTLYMVGLLYLSIASPVLDSPDPDMLISAGRFLVVAAPIFLLLGRWTERRPWLDLLLVSGGFLLQAVLAGFFLAYGWLI